MWTSTQSVISIGKLEEWRVRCGTLPNQIVLAIKERGKHKKNKHLELARIYIQQLDSHIVFHHEELENYKDYYQRLVKTLNETEAEIEKEISFRLKTCNKDIKENCVLGDVRHRVEAGTKGKIK